MWRTATPRRPPHRRPHSSAHGRRKIVMPDNTPGPMACKTVLVTGGTGGIGRATAAGLAALGARGAIPGRDLVRTRAAAADITKTTGNPAVDAFAADMSSQAEVRRLAREVLPRTRA